MIFIMKTTWTSKAQAGNYVTLQGLKYLVIS